MLFSLNLLILSNYQAVMQYVIPIAVTNFSMQ